MHHYAYHRVTATPRQWLAVADQLRTGDSLARAGASLFGIWRSQIGRPRDELNVITHWSDAIDVETAEEAVRGDASRVENITFISTELMAPTLRPESPDRPTRQGNYAFRWFSTPVGNWDEFLALCAEAWPGFESAYDSQVIGLWRMSGERTGGVVEEATGAGLFEGNRSLLLTRRPDLAMWERSKLPQGDAEAKVRETLSQRYDLCDWTAVNTATLLTAEDRRDTARWT